MNTPTRISQRLIPILDVFSEKFHKAFPEEHRIASPLGAWCLLAFVAANDANAKPEVIKNLGCSPAEAKTILTALLKEKPAVVSLAVNSWLAPGAAGGEGFVKWSESVKDLHTANVGIPQKEELNDWVSTESLGLIEDFPVSIDPDNFIALFATVIATDIKWDVPLDVITHKSMETAWGIEKCLIDRKENVAHIHRDSMHGDFAVHCGTTGEKDLNVYSVIALSDNVSEADTMAVARSIATGHFKSVALSELPLGESENGTLAIRELKYADKTDDVFTTVLPAWKSSNTFDLLPVDLGFGQSVERFVGSARNIDIDVKQVTVAEYNAVGFKAAALTYMMVSRSAAMPTGVKALNAIITFNRPYAVVATVNTNNPAWNSVPVFDGWITEAVEAVKAETK